MKMKRRDFLKTSGAFMMSGLLVAQQKQGDALMTKSQVYQEFSRKIPVIGEYDIIVAGGGPSGCAAALAARRAGLSVLLVEGQGQLGGMGTSGLVSHWLGGRTDDCKRWVVGGLFREMSREAAELGFALIPEQEPDGRLSPHGWGRGQLTAGIPFDPFAMAAYLDSKIADAGVDVLLLTQVVDVCVNDNRITHVFIFNKSGLQAVSAVAVVDATGDADLAARSGCEIVVGREEDSLMTPATLEFHVDNADQDALSAYIHEHKAPRFLKEIKDWEEQGKWTLSTNRFISVQLDQKGTMMINTPRVMGVDGTNGASVTDGMIRGRKRIFELLEIMRKYIPGFEDVRLKAVAPLLGVRETRRIVGDYVLTVDDLVAGRDFDDTIGFSAYGWDLLDPKRPNVHSIWDRKARKKRNVTPIPYGIMAPHPVTNLVCPGRAVSVERDVLGPLRVMASCMAMGEASGQAAKQVVEKNIAFRDVNVGSLRGELKQNGAIVDWHT